MCARGCVFGCVLAFPGLRPPVVQRRPLGTSPHGGRRTGRVGTRSRAQGGENQQRYRPAFREREGRQQEVLGTGPPQTREPRTRGPELQVHLEASLKVAPGDTEGIGRSLPGKKEGAFVKSAPVPHPACSSLSSALMSLLAHAEAGLSPHPPALAPTGGVLPSVSPWFSSALSLSLSRNRAPPLP